MLLLHFDLDTEFVELFLADGRRGLAHDIAAAVVLGEGNEVADGVGAAEERAETVEAEGKTGVGRCAVGEGIHKEAELRLCLFVGESQRMEHLVLEGAVVDTDGAAAHLDTVHDDIVGVGADVAPAVRVVEQCLIFRLGSRERMVHGVEALRLVVPFEEREVDNPKRSEHLRVAETQLVAHLKTQGAELGARLHGGAAKEQHKVSRFGVRLLSESTEVVLAVELVDRGLEGAVAVVFDIDHAAGAHLGTLDEIGEGVELLARVFGTAGSANTDNQFGVVEESESLAFGDVVELDELHTEADVRLVGAKAAHGVMPCDTRESVEIESLDLMEEVLGEAFKGLEHILLFDERHLTVDLGEFRLTVGAEVFIAETADNLEVAVHAGHHQELFVLLRGLRQGVELAWVHAGRNDEVAGSFGRGLDKERRLYFEEIEVAEIVADQHRHAVAQFQVAAHRIATDIKVTILHAKVIAAVRLVFNSEGRCLGGVEDVEFLDVDLDFAGSDLGVLGGAFDDGAFDLEDVFASQTARLLTEVGVGFHIEGQLGDAVAVTKVNESHAAQVAGALEPAAEGNGLTDVGAV